MWRQSSFERFILSDLCIIVNACCRQAVSEIALFAYHILYPGKQTLDLDCSDSEWSFVNDTRLMIAFRFIFHELQPSKLHGQKPWQWQSCNQDIDCFKTITLVGTCGFIQTWDLSASLGVSSLRWYVNLSAAKCISSADLCLCVARHWPICGACSANMFIRNEINQIWPACQLLGTCGSTGLLRIVKVPEFGMDFGEIIVVCLVGSMDGDPSRWQSTKDNPHPVHQASYIHPPSLSFFLSTLS
jgi:hypothetical protein